jgi:hypothetical protein
LRIMVTTLFASRNTRKTSVPLSSAGMRGADARDCPVSDQLVEVSI